MIVGYGAAGIIIGAQLRVLGFRSIRVLEKSANLGIWSREDVYKGSRNNPFDIVLQGSRFLNQAPGEGSEVRSTLSNNLVFSSEKLALTKIVPGQLTHKIETAHASAYTSTDTYPIVINCIGLGKPVPLSDSSRMRTETTATESGAIRWQKQLKQEEMKGKMYILIGLGNSTAEMLRQIHNAQDSGVDVDYRVFTHYSYDSIMNPDDTVPLPKHQVRWNTRHGIKRNNYRVFRDLSATNLTSYQGDLPLSRYDYYRALNTQRILSDVHSWDSDGRTISYDRRNKRFVMEFDHLYHLTGYRHTADSLKDFGCAWDAKQLGPKYDYDGELQDACGRRFKGYFGFGAVLESEWNKNATVIPGMFHRIGDLLFSVVMRATEYSLSK